MANKEHRTVTDPDIHEPKGASTAASGRAYIADGAGSGAWTAVVKTSDIGVTVQAYDAQLADVAGLTPTDNGVVIGNGTNFVVESGATLKTSLGLTIGTDVQAYDADTLKADVADVLTAGFAATPYNAGTKSTGTFTPDEANGNFQYAVNGGAHTLAPPTNNCTLIIQYTNNGSAGTITTSGFTKVDGDSLTTTNGDDFFLQIIKCNGFSSLTVKALQ